MAQSNASYDKNCDCLVVVLAYDEDNDNKNNGLYYKDCFI